MGDRREGARIWKEKGVCWREDRREARQEHQGGYRFDEVELLGVDCRRQDQSLKVPKIKRYIEIRIY